MAIKQQADNEEPNQPDGVSKPVTVSDLVDQTPLSRSIQQHQVLRTETIAGVNATRALALLNQSQMTEPFAERGLSCISERLADCWRQPREVYSHQCV